MPKDKTRRWNMSNVIVLIAVLALGGLCYYRFVVQKKSDPPDKKGPGPKK